jgi:hypothetical protein
MKGAKRLNKSRKRRRSKKETVDAWARWQLLATVTRIAIVTLQPFLDHFFGDGPGRLL